MKLSRDQLKSLVKECLVEILAEGVGGALKERIERPVKKTIHERLDEPTRSHEGDQPLPTQALKDAVKESAGGDPIMESILADTASKTLPQMLRTDKGCNVAGGRIEQIVAASKPEEIFGEDAASKWADLAFMQPANTPQR
jgi:hypothetical protein